MIAVAPHKDHRYASVVLLSLFTATAPVIIMAATSSQSHGDWIKSGSWDKTKFSDAFGYGN